MSTQTTFRTYHQTFPVKADFTYLDGSKLILRHDFAQDSLNTIQAEDIAAGPAELDATLQTDSPLLARLFQAALRSVESNIIHTKGSAYFGAGSEFGPKVFTRDIAYSGILGLNTYYPELMKSSLQYTRYIRKRVGFNITRVEYQEDPDIPWIPEDLSRDEFVAKYQTNSLLNRTDDVCWLWAAADLFAKNPELADWQYLLDEGKFFFETFYNRFFDATDGLYRGQATFVDIGYPNPLGTGYNAKHSLYERIQIKTLSTNCLYLQGLQAMATAAQKLGLIDESNNWVERREKLATAIKSELMLPNGLLSYYKSPTGELEPRQDALGIAFAFTAGILEGEAAEQHVSNYPISDAGFPLFDPFYPDTRWYHNHSSWPFVDAFLFRGIQSALGKETRPEAAALLALTCNAKGNFHEVRDYRSKEVKGSKNQLWTAAAFLGLFEKSL